MKNIGDGINELKSNAAADRADSLIASLAGLCSEASELFTNMELEARTHEPATRKELNEKVSQYKKLYQNLKSDFERAKEKSNRSALIGAKSDASRGRVMDTNDKYYSCATLHDVSYDLFLLISI